MKIDAISIIEAAYDLEADTHAWLSRLLDLIGPRIERGFGSVAFAYDLKANCAPSTVVARNVDEGLARSVFAMTSAFPERQRKILGTQRFSLATQRLGLTEAEAARFPPHVEYLHPFGVRDVIALTALDPSGHGYVFTAGVPDVARPMGPECGMWNRVAVHVAAAARLRASARTAAGAFGDADAVLSPSGDVEHAGDTARAPSVRESLRRAARSIDRARSKARADDGEALDLWKGLVAGRWSLVDRFDSDGRRFLIARRNDPNIADPRALTRRERQVMALLAVGQSIKVTAYALGLSAATVAKCRARAMRKLGLQSSCDVVALFGAAFGEPDEPIPITERSQEMRPTGSSPLGGS